MKLEFDLMELLNAQTCKLDTEEPGEKIKDAIVSAFSLSLVFYFFLIFISVPHF